MKMFERDWLHAISKDKFATFIARENKNNTNNNKPSDDECTKQIHEIFKKYYKKFYSCFLYYGRTDRHPLAARTRFDGIGDQPFSACSPWSLIPPLSLPASIGSGSPYHIQLNPWTMFLDAANIPDADSPYIKRSDCDTLFIVSNYMPDKKAPEMKVNRGREGEGRTAASP